MVIFLAGLAGIARLNFCNLFSIGGGRRNRTLILGFGDRCSTTELFPLSLTLIYRLFCKNHSYYTKPKGRRQYPAAEYGNRFFASLFRFFVRCVFLAPGTVFFKLQPRFDFFNIPRSPIIDAVAISAFKFNEIVLAHISANFINNTSLL